MRRLPHLAGLIFVAAVLAACSSSQDVLEPSAISPHSAVQPGDEAAVPPPQTASTGASAPLNPAVAARTRLHFDPIVGATVETATPLTERLAVRARARGIMLAGNADPATTHVLKGYFSTMTEGNQTIVLYVWDVYDPSGNRLHRINGQQKATAGAGEGWSAVSAATMQQVADDTIDQLATWIAGATG